MAAQQKQWNPEGSIIGYDEQENMSAIPVHRRAPGLLSAKAEGRTPAPAHAQCDAVEIQNSNFKWTPYL
jgi:hypothetical protein